MTFSIMALADSSVKASPERSRAEAAIGLVAARLGARGAVFDLSDIGPSLTGAADLAALSYFSRTAIEAIRRADALVLVSASPCGGFSADFARLLALLGADFLGRAPTFTLADAAIEEEGIAKLLRWVDRVHARQVRVPALLRL